MAQAQPPLSSLKNILRGCLIEMGVGGGGEGELGLECKVEKLKYNGWRSCIQDQKGCGGG